MNTNISFVHTLLSWLYNIKILEKAVQSGKSALEVRRTPIHDTSYVCCFVTLVPAYLSQHTSTPWRRNCGSSKTFYSELYCFLFDRLSYHPAQSISSSWLAKLKKHWKQANHKPHTDLIEFNPVLHDLLPTSYPFVSASSWTESYQRRLYLRSSHMRTQFCCLRKETKKTLTSYEFFQLHILIVSTIL